MNSTITLPITADDIATIVAIEDPVLRNLWITQSYADFAERLGAAIDPANHTATSHTTTNDAPRNHTWCGFAVWASATAGQSIRQEELPAVITDIIHGTHGARIAAVNAEVNRHWFRRFLKRLEGVHLVDAIRGALDNVSEHIAHGNSPPDSVFRSWDLTGGTGVGEEARDWAVLEQRMNYIVNLFRSRQQDPSLAAAPFTPEQITTMQSGKVPSGPLLPPGRPTGHPATRHFSWPR